MGALSGLSPDTNTADEVIRLLGLEPLAREGGFYRRTAESTLMIPSDAQPLPEMGSRRTWSSILALFTPDECSALHRLRGDELWCFNAGDPLEALRLYPDGRGEWTMIGLDPTRNQSPQDIVSANVWQGARLAAGGRWALVSCVAVPEFSWSDFEIGSREELVSQYAAWKDDIVALTRE